MYNLVGLEIRDISDTASCHASVKTSMGYLAFCYDNTGGNFPSSLSRSPCLRIITGVYTDNMIQVALKTTSNAFTNILRRQ
jgi:hypothetical protein